METKHDDLPNARQAMDTAIDAGLMPPEQERQWVLAVGRAFRRLRQRYDIPQPVVGRALNMSQPRVSACEKPDPANPKTFTWLEIHQLETLIRVSGIDINLAFGEVFRLAKKDMVDAVILVRDRLDSSKVTRVNDELVSSGITPEEAIAQDPEIGPDFRKVLLIQVKAARDSARLTAVDKMIDPMRQADDSPVKAVRTRRQIQPAKRRSVGGVPSVDGAGEKLLKDAGSTDSLGPEEQVAVDEGASPADDGLG